MSSIARSRPSAATAFIAACALLGSAPAARAQLWQEFAHPNTPHVDLTNPTLPIAMPGLFADPAAVVSIPVLLVLLEFDDLTHATEHTVAFYADMVFGTGSTGPWTSARPSVVQTWEESTNGRLRLVPATAGDNVDGAADGIVGWVTAQCPPGVPGTCGSTYYGGEIRKKRAEGIRRADPFFDYSLYDTDGDGIVSSDELVVVVINADDACCDDHAAAGHGDPAGCVGCPGGNARRTDPNQVLVEGIPPDGVLVHQLVAGLTEGAHANVCTHEIGHQLFGLGDLYDIETSAGNPYLEVSDGYVWYPWVSCGAGCKKASNDDCASALCLEDGVTAHGSTVDSTGTDLSSCAFNDTIDVWFTYTPSRSEDVTFSLCIPGCNANSTVFDTTLSVFDGCGGNELPGACNDDYDCGGDGSIDAPCDRASALTLPLAAGTTYWVRVAGYDAATGNYRLTVQGGGGACGGYPPTRWLPHGPGRYSVMASYPDGHLTHLDPWGKVHLGFVKPRVVTHDGYYSVFDARVARSFAQQGSEPEALVVYDPLRPNPYEQYFVLENRDLTDVGGTTTDRGLAVWQIDENVTPGDTQLNLRRAVRLVRRGGFWAWDADSLWDGTDAVQGYDLTASSTPRDTSWTDGSASHVEITEISAAGPVMTCFVRMTPIFVDGAGSPPAPDGTETWPWPTVIQAVNAVAGQDLDADGVQDGPRTIRLEAGSYAESLVIGAPCTLTAENGNAVIGR